MSYQFKLPVAQLLAERFPATLELALISALFAVCVGIPLGVYCGLYHDSFMARLFQAISLVGVSLPTFLIGILLIFIFAVQLSWLPALGRGEVVNLGFWSTGLLTKSGLLSLILPSITLGLFQMTLIMRLVRAEMMEVLRTDYIKFARGRGLTESRHQFRPRVEEHADPGDHHHRTSARLHHCLRHYHRVSVQLARHGPALHPGG